MSGGAPSAAGELLAAVKEHATAEDDFTFEPRDDSLARVANLIVASRDGNVWVNVRDEGRGWIEVLNDHLEKKRETYPHASASSAVHSAFLRARGKSPPCSTKQ